MNTIEVMKQALEALDVLVSQQPDPSFFPEEYMAAKEAITNFRNLIEQMEKQEQHHYST